MNEPIRVLSYNIHKGFATNNKTFVLKNIKKNIRLVKADLVFLQEVLGHHDEHGKKLENWPTTSQFEYLADSIWPHMAYGKNAVYSSGHHGNSILSRYPFSSWENINVSTNRFENRGILHGIVKVPQIAIPMHVICIHLGLLESWRQKQIEVLCSRISEHVPPEAPLIVAGDFNDWREKITPVLQKELQLNEVFWQLHQRHMRTFPAWLPILKLDRIYVRGLQIIEANRLTSMAWRTLSDHAALTSTLAHIDKPVVTTA